MPNPHESQDAEKLLRQLIDRYAHVIERLEENERTIKRIENRIRDFEVSPYVGLASPWNGHDRREDNILTDRQRNEVRRISEDSQSIRVGKSTLGIILLVVGAVAVAGVLAFLGFKGH